MARYEEQQLMAEQPHQQAEVEGPSSMAGPNEHSQQAIGVPLPNMPSSSPLQPNQALPSLAAKRKAASGFIKAVTGQAIPYATDQSFRAALKDGVLLCKLANAVWPGAVKQILEQGDVEGGPSGLLALRDHNLNAFLSAVRATQQVPSDCMFGIPDLEAEHEERPQVANCLLFIRSIASLQQPQTASPFQQQQQRQHARYPDSNLRSSMEDMMGTPPRSSFDGSLQQRNVQQQQQYGLVTPPSAGAPFSTRLSFAATTPGSAPGSFGARLQARCTPGGNEHPALPQPLSSPLMEAHSSLSHSHTGSLMPYHSSSSSLTPASMHGGSIHAASHKSVQAAAGVTRLMQQCTHMLKERMFPDQHGLQRPSHTGPATPDTAMKALGPVLEGVLGQLTEEYERRLLTKDHELGKALEAARRAEAKLQQLQGQYDQLQREVDERSRAAVKASEESCAADAAVLQQQLEEAKAALATAEAELAQARAALSTADSAHLDAYHALQAESMMLRTRLGELLPIEEKYKSVLQENRELYNTVQDLRGNIRVFCRIRPPGVTGDLSPCCVDVGLEGDLAVYDAPSGIKKVFKVDRVFDQSVDQTIVYEDTQPLIRSVLDGYNVCIFAYGQTGSGKTHTMSGTNTEEASGRGINYRALDDLFGIRDSRSETEYTFRVQMLEIYNENLRDLLVDGRSAGVNKLDILATQASGCNVPGATQVEVFNAGDVVALMARGASQRATSETKMNDRSSRSHQILTVIVDGFNTVTKAASHGCLHLIDLAGSERVGKSEASGDRLVEAQHINKSLSALGDVMAALASKNGHVPYRNSKLTQLLQDSLQGNAKVMMFMHISPEANMFSESVSTLKFATRVSQITLGQAKKNVVSGKVFEAQEEVMKTQKTLETKDQQVQQLQAALQHSRTQEANLRANNEQLQQRLQQLEQQLQQQQQLSARRESSAGADAATPPRNPLHLPLSQLQSASQHQAALAALNSSRGHGHGESVSGSPMAAGGGHSPFSPAGGGADGSASKIGRMRVDRTPARDQDELSLLSEGSRTALDPAALALLQQEHSDPLLPPRTARSTRSSSSNLRASHAQHPREQASAARHAERMHTARQSGVFRAAPNSSSGGGSSGTGAGAHSSPGGAAAALGSLNKALSRIGGLVPPSSTAASSGRVKDVPQTSRVSGVARPNRLSDGGGTIPSFSTTSRQSGVFGSSKAAAGAAGGGGAVTSRAAATARAGSRWK